MKNKIIKIILVLLLFTLGFISLRAAFVLFSPAAPVDIKERVETGADIEDFYLAEGKYTIKIISYEADEILRRHLIFYPEEMEEKENNKKYPVIVSENGTATKASMYSNVLQHFSSWGFIVIGNETEDSWTGESSDKAIDFLIEQNKDENSIFYNKVDLDNIGIVGHSQGGVAVFNSITERKHRNIYKTAVALSPVDYKSAEVIGWKYDLTKIDIPILILAGIEGTFETEMVANIDELNTMYDDISSKKVMGRKKGQKHMQMLFSSNGYVNAWFNWHLKGDEKAKKAFNVKEGQPELLENKLYQDVRINY